jgi:hypothetical protein
MRRKREKDRLILKKNEFFFLDADIREYRTQN